MISQEGQPGLGLVRSSPSLDHILPDGVWAGWIETEQHQMSMDGFGTPQDILATQTSDQRSHFLADGWTASFPSRFPAPPLEKGMLMPLEYRLGFHQLGRRLPSGPHPGQQHPQEAKRWVKPRAGLSLLADTFFANGELTAHGYHLTSQ